MKLFDELVCEHVVRTWFHVPCCAFNQVGASDGINSGCRTGIHAEVRVAIIAASGILELPNMALTRIWVVVYFVGGNWHSYWRSFCLNRIYPHMDVPSDHGGFASSPGSLGAFNERSLLHNQIFVYIYIYMFSLSLSLSLYIYIYIYVRAYIYIYICIDLYLSLFVYLSFSICIYL